jgi:multiple sugar transport system permease protein
MIYPFLWAFCASFKTSGQIYNDSPLNLIPSPITFVNYQHTWQILPFGRFLLNSLVLAIVIPFTMIIFSSICAYAFARLNFKGKNIIFFLFLATMMVPSHVTLIPNFAIISKLGWIDNYLSLFVNSVFTGVNAFNIFFFRQYFMSIPKDLESAAIIDGCNRARVYFKIILPNAKPAIATVAILSFRSVWNSFLWPMLVINDYNKMTVTVGLQYFKGAVQNQGELFAGTVLTVIPVILVFLFFQKYFINSTVNSGFGGT